MAAILSVYPYAIVTEILTKYYRVLQLWRTKLMRHVARKRKERKTHSYFLGKPEGKRLLGKCTFSWGLMELVFKK